MVAESAVLVPVRVDEAEHQTLRALVTRLTSETMNPMVQFSRSRKGTFLIGKAGQRDSRRDT